MISVIVSREITPYRAPLLFMIPPLFVDPEYYRLFPTPHDYYLVRL